MDTLQKNTMPDQYSATILKKPKSNFLKSLFNFGGVCLPHDFHENLESERKICIDIPIFYQGPPSFSENLLENTSHFGQTRKIEKIDTDSEASIQQFDTVDALERNYEDEVLMATCIKKAPGFILSDESSPLKTVNQTFENENDTPSLVVETEPAAELDQKINFSQWNPDNQPYARGQYYQGTEFTDMSVHAMRPLETTKLTSIKKFQQN